MLGTLKTWLLRRRKPPERIIGYDQYLQTNSPRRALLSYLAQPVWEARKNRPARHFSNAGLVRSWAKVLNQAGYIVDVINWYDTDQLEHQYYDLVIAHGGRNTDELLRAKKPGGKLVYWASGAYWKFNNSQGEARAKNLLVRHGVRVEHDRKIESEEKICRAADAIICLGTPDAVKSFAGFDNLWPIEIATFPDDHFLLETKDYEQARRNFLFFAGGGNLHKGLDLALDAFAKITDADLYICTLINDQFQEIYREVLQQDNIHYLGIVELGTKQFYEVADKCGFVLSLSCSEGGPGSIADCMIQGLVPLATPESLVWLEDAGFEVTSIQPNKLSEQIMALSKIIASELKDRSRAIYDHASTAQSPKSFEAGLKKAIQAIIDPRKVQSE